MIVVNQAMDVLAQGNIVTTPGTGLGVYGSFTAHTTTFNNNTVTAGAIGIEVTTDTLGANGNQNVSATITNNNEISGAATGILVTQVTGKTASVQITNNTGNGIHGNTLGIDLNGGAATITGNHLYNNTTAIRLKNAATATVNTNDFEGAANPDNGTDLRL